MINSDKGNLNVRGNSIDITFELCMILTYFIKTQPEVLGGILAVYGDKLKTILSTCNPNVELLDEYKKMTEIYVKLYEGEKT